MEVQIARISCSISAGRYGRVRASTVSVETAYLCGLVDCNEHQ
jgi:hypothetical protein